MSPIQRCKSYRWIGMGLALALASACGPGAPTPVLPEISPTVPAYLNRETLDLGEVQGLRRLPLGTPALAGFYEVRIRSTRVEEGHVEALLHLRRLSKEEAERQQFFNPLFFSISEEYGFGLELVTLDPLSRTFSASGAMADGGYCTAGGKDPPGMEMEVTCSFPVPGGQLPAYLRLVGLRRGAAVWLPIPFEGRTPLALIPLGLPLPGAEGLVPEAPIAPGAVARLPDGAEIAVREARVLPSVLVASQPTPFETSPGEGWAFLAVHLRLHCPEGGCRGGFYMRSDDSSGGCSYIGPAPYRDCGGGMGFGAGPQEVELVFVIPREAAHLQLELVLPDGSARFFALPAPSGP